ncbi:DUF6009 family protein [Streptomyces sp. S1A]|uniref:DUF6009 family protein n=1 Tax=Streptomyces sp. ICN903 TaxID=2964654 RepID=UPI001EDC0DB6|nr:DUF6009 family protein [Streptomyces sp. ICN903]MCG3039181.1 DUF6009 family protein [Streptomyces sp. ICN903]
MIKDPADLRHEDGIVWTEDTERLDYVREYVDQAATSRRRPVPWRGAGRRVGYSVLAPAAPNNGQPGMFTRRVFWVNDHDRSEQPDGVYATGTPSEGVDPRTVAPGAWGRMTDRAWGAPRTPAAVAERIEAARAKQERRRRQRAELAEAREYGLTARHAAKLRRWQRQDDGGDAA